MSARSRNTENVIAGVAASVALTALLVLLAIAGRQSSPQPPTLHPSSEAAQKLSSPDDLIADADRTAKEYARYLSRTPERRQKLDRISTALKRIEIKDAALARFQSENAISDQIAEAAIKEWVLTHNANVDWDLEDVKRICFRNKMNGIPHEYLPYAEQQKKASH